MLLLFASILPTVAFGLSFNSGDHSVCPSYSDLFSSPPYDSDRVCAVCYPAGRDCGTSCQSANVWNPQIIEIGTINLDSKRHVRSTFKS